MPVAFKGTCPVPGLLHFPPPYSPDLHQVIEHAHANTVMRFREWLHKQGNKVPHTNVMQYMDDVDRCFREGNPQESVHKNVSKLFEKVHAAVVEAKGDYIPHNLR
jgi:hypothetical protein